jgi:hypothetical protein
MLAMWISNHPKTNLLQLVLPGILGCRRAPGIERTNWLLGA